MCVYNTRGVRVCMRATQREYARDPITLSVHIYARPGNIHGRPTLIPPPSLVLVHRDRTRLSVNHCHLFIRTHTRARPRSHTHTHTDVYLYVIYYIIIYKRAIIDYPLTKVYNNNIILKKRAKIT